MAVDDIGACLAHELDRLIFGSLFERSLRHLQILLRHLRIALQAPSDDSSSAFDNPSAHS